MPLPPMPPVPRPEGLFDVTINLPAEVKAALARIGPTLDRVGGFLDRALADAFAAAWWDGARTGFVAAILVALAVGVLWRRQSPP